MAYVSTKLCSNWDAEPDQKMGQFHRDLDIWPKTLVISYYSDDKFISVASRLNLGLRVENQFGNI
jgi:hypothetical protein